MKKQIMLCIMLTALVCMTACDKEENPVVPQEIIDSYIDASKISHIKDWHFNELPIMHRENMVIMDIEFPMNQTALADLPDWLPYVAARFASGIPLYVFKGKWKSEDVYLFYSSEMSTRRCYDANGNRIDSESVALLMGEAADWSCVACLEKEEESFDAIAMFGKHIDSDLVGTWKHDKGGNTLGTSCMEFRSNGSGRLWEEIDGAISGEHRFLYTIVDVKLTGAASNWIIVKMATEGSELTRYESFVIKDGMLYYAEDLSSGWCSSYDK